MTSLPGRLLAVSSVALCATFLAGCSTTPDRRAIEETRRSVPSLAAQEPFFDGRLVAHLTIGSSLAGQGTSSKPGGGKGPPSGGRHHGRHRDSGESHGERGSGEGYDPNNADEIRARYVDSPMPPALLQLKLENTSAAPITVEVRDLNSELGNFATRPDKFSIEPGGTGEPGPMQSLLGVDSLALPVTLTLRSEGKTETKTLTLRPAANPESKP